MPRRDKPIDHKQEDYCLQPGAKAPSEIVSIFMAGDINVIKQACREFTYSQGLCVTVAPTTYVYTGGAEEGVVIGLINYPKFPSDHINSIENEAILLAGYLTEAACQKSCTIQCGDFTRHYTRRHGGFEEKK